MRIPFSWLQSYFSKKLDVNRVASALTQAGLEVESIERPEKIKGSFVVGRVLEVKKHPNADRLSVCRVATKKGEERTIVCGAPNVASGQNVVVALPGAVLHSGLEIRKAAIRDVDSDGMICAEDELGIGTDHSGIIVLDDSLNVGKKITAEDFVDVVLETEVTANRTDWLSLNGVAREVGALFNIKPSFPESHVKESAIGIKSRRSVKVAKACASQYHLREISGIARTESPSWLKRRLLSMGVASQHLAVDATNYVLYEYGQPLHAFDADAIRGKTISVRPAKPREKITLLDGKTYQLISADIVIADSSGPIALAGVMGGQSTAVTQKTSHILLESAIFPPASIRRTSRRLGIRTDSANRFERGISPSIPVKALDRASALIAELSGAKILKGRLSAPFSIPRKKNIEASIGSMERLIGRRFSIRDAQKLLTRIGCNVRKSGSSKLLVTPPDFRSDLHIEADVAEEIARLIGYTKITPTLPSMKLRASSIDPMLSLIHDMRKALVMRGYSEIILQSFYGAELARHATLPIAEHREVDNPLDASQQYLRTDVLPGLLDIVEKQRNVDRSARVFEVGQVFWRTMKPGEFEWRLSFAQSSEESGSYEALVEDMAWLFHTVLHVEERRIEIGRHAKCADVRISGIPVGFIATKVLKKGQVVVAIECSLQELLQLKKPLRYRPLPKFPSVFRDISLIAPRELDRFTLLRQLYRASSCLVRAELFDVRPQSGASISYAFHLEFQAPERTLRATDVDFEMKAITRALQEKGGLVRS